MTEPGDQARDFEEWQEEFGPTEPPTFREGGPLSPAQQRDIHRLLFDGLRDQADRHRDQVENPGPTDMEEPPDEDGNHPPLS